MWLNGTCGTQHDGDHEWLQHDRAARGKDAVIANENKVQARLFGTEADRSIEALSIALSL